MGVVYYYLGDHVGTTRMMANAAGTMCYDADYTPFGQELAYTNNCLQNYKFTGTERDMETGNDHAWFRNYQWNLGRWMSPDPLSGDVTNPQSLNRYSYVLNIPTTLTDPFGLDEGDCSDPTYAESHAECPTPPCDPDFEYCGCDPSDPTCGGVWGGGGGGWYPIPPPIPIPGGPSIPSGIPGNADFPNGNLECSVVGGVFTCRVTVNGSPWWTASIPPAIGGGLAGAIVALLPKGYYWNPGDQLINTHHPGTWTFRNDTSIVCSSHVLVEKATGVVQPPHVDTVNPVPLSPVLLGPAGISLWWPNSILAHWLADVKGYLPSSVACSQ